MTHGFQIGHNLALSGDQVTICNVPACADCHTSPPAFVAHRDCWNVATEAGRTPRSLYYYAARTERTATPRYSTPPDAVPAFSADMETTTSLGRFLNRVATRLPVELHDEIGQHLRGHFVASLLHASHAARCVRRRSPYLGPTRAPVGGAGPVRSMFVRTRIMFGLRYICEIGLNKPWGEVIKTGNPGVRGVRFAVGSHGLRALRVLFRDGSASSWLGDPRYCWYGEFYGSDLRALTVTSDVCPVEARARSPVHLLTLCDS